MKRMFAILLSAALLLSLLPACNQQGAARPTQPAESDASAPEPTATASAPVEAGLNCGSVMNSVWGAIGVSIPDAEVLYSGADDPNDYMRLSAYMEGAYGLVVGEWEEAALVRATGASAVELAVLRFADEDAAQHGEGCLKDYLHSREGDFTGYAPEQAALVADGAVRRQGKYLGLFICEDSARAGDLFDETIRTGELPAAPAPTPTPTPEPIQDAAELLERFIADCYFFGGDDTSNLERVDSSAPDRLKAIVEGEYGLAGYPWTDAAIARGTDGNVFEMAVLHFDGDPENMDAVKTVNAYLDAKEAAYARFPAQSELLHEGLAAWNDGFMAVLVCKEPRGIAIHLGSYLGKTGSNSGFQTFTRYREDEPEPSIAPDPVHPEREKFTQPNKDDMSLYDTSAIRAAWAAGDPSGLSDYDRATYDAAQAILGEILSDGMTGLEKETAIFHWLVNNVDYDWRHQDILSEASRSSFEPYGGLVDHMAVCLGYATSFQLLCDLAGLECITVVGAAFHSEEDHGWNMVRLNGNWYCVDVTWDANGREQVGPGEPEDWRYFNITSDEMAAKNHQWDYANVPEATAADRGQG